MFEIMQWLQGTALAAAVAEVWFPRVECLHVIAMAMLAGTIFIVDTRLLGLTSREHSFRYLSQRLLPWTWVAFTVSVLTGSLMFMSNATGYYGNSAFRLKMLLLVLAGLNMLYFQFVTFRGVAAWDHGHPPVRARLAGLASVGIWCTVIASGRWIGFSL
jgi:hypothetical protein